MKKIKHIQLFVLCVMVVLFVWVSVRMVRKEKELHNEIGQMIMVGFRGTDASSPKTLIRRIIQDINLGGVVLFEIDVPSGYSFPRNIVDSQQTKKLIADLQKSARVPLFIAVDAEGGRVNRLNPQYGFADIPSAERVGYLDDMAYTSFVANLLAVQLAAVGCNMNFAPVVDVNSNPENPVIGALGRAFSDDPRIVAQHAREYIAQARKRKIISVLKHFPGHGSSHHDSHIGLVDVTESYDQQELDPYELLIWEGNVDCIMTAHIVNRTVDDKYPATLSRKHLKEMLRYRLNFNGVIISDDMQMGAIGLQFGFDEAIVRAINAGCDIILVSNNGKEYIENIAYEVHRIIRRGVRERKISRSRIAEASNRIATLKKTYALTRV